MSDNALRGLLRAGGLTDDLIDHVTRPLVAPDEEAVAAVVWAVDLDIADDYMIPLPYEILNGICVPRRTQRTEGGYTLLASHIKRGTTDFYLPLEDARIARARYLLWHGYYVSYYHRAPYIEQDALRRLYWSGQEPPPSVDALLIDSALRRLATSK